LLNLLYKCAYLSIPLSARSLTPVAVLAILRISTYIFFIEPQRHREYSGRESADVYILEYVLKFDD
jgi:hypothetical protein